MQKQLLIYIGKHIHGLGNRALLKINEDYDETISLSTFPYERYILPQYCHHVRTQLEHAQLNEKQWQEKMECDSFFTYNDTCYPSLLKHIDNPPILLFFNGNIQLLKHPCLAMIGSRKACDYSLKKVDDLVKELIHRYVIVSGLAYGIDSRSHQRAIFHQGKTIAVVGNGLDVYYPKSHYALQHKIAKDHLLLSEYPAGTQPKPYHFPERNRIIAGLCEGVCVLQAAKQSGTSITAMQALDNGRDVFALPGLVDDPQFVGCHHLIQDGAKLITCADDILNELLHWRYGL